MNNKQIVLTLGGTARQVFRYLALLARYQGNIKVGDMLCQTKQDPTDSRRISGD